MPQRKESVKKELAKKRLKLIKLSALSKAELAKINVDDLWIIRPEPGAKVTRSLYCGCRNVCEA